MEDQAQPMAPLPEKAPRARRSLLAMLSSGFAVLGLLMILFVPDRGPVEYYTVILLALIIAALLTGGIGLSHIFHDQGVQGKRWAIFGIGLGLLEMFFGAWALAT
jgi:hypothetical protein